MYRTDLTPEQQALLWLGGVGEFQLTPGHPYYTVRAMAEGMRRYNDAMLQLCKAENVECIDLTGMDKSTATFYDDVHFNEAGARAVARIVAEHFKAHPPFAAAAAR